MKAADANIAWTPLGYDGLKSATAGRVQVGPRSNPGGWMDSYPAWVYAVESSDIAESPGRAAWRLMVNFHTLVVRDGINPQVAHQAFLAIDEYRAMISPDIPGATYEECNGN